MKRSPKKIVGFILATLCFTSSQNVFATPKMPDIEIPVQEVVHQEDIPKRTIDYSEDFWVVSDEGIFDDNGYYVEKIIDDTGSEVIIPMGDDNGDSSQEDAFAPDSLEAYQQSIIESWGGKKAFTMKRLDGVKENLSEQMQRFQELEDQIADAEEKLVPIQEEVTTLQGQIDLLNGQIRLMKDKITSTEILVAEKKIEIKDIMFNLQKSQIELDIQKKIVTDYVKLLYEEEGEYFDLYDEGSNTLKLLLADSSVNETLMGKEYLEVMEKTGREVFYGLERGYREMNEKQNDLITQQHELEFLYDALQKEKRDIEETRATKKELLEKTQGEEEKYQMFLEEAIQEQLETSIAVQNLQENIGLIESKLATLDDGLDDVQSAENTEQLVQAKETMDMIASLVDEEGADEDVVSQGVMDQQSNVKKARTFFEWPVPANKITAKFHDPNYPKRWGVHQAIDIRTPQSTEIRAPANGYVFQTKDNGNGYSYIILAHKNSLVTVYGHVSEILVKPGTIVKQGQVIGLSGGRPGTKGAGLQTTGPHLHFEVHYKGEPVNPLDYLPLEEMPIEYVPDEYLKSLK